MIQHKMKALKKGIFIARRVNTPDPSVKFPDASCIALIIQVFRRTGFR